jgi:putative membrane protein
VWVVSGHARPRSCSRPPSVAFFWAKIASFAAIGLLSVPPTLEFIRWKKSLGAPTDAAVRSVRRYLHIQLMLFVQLPIFAAAMARGYGEFT